MENDKNESRQPKTQAERSSDFWYWFDSCSNRYEMFDLVLEEDGPEGCQNFINRVMGELQEALHAYNPGISLLFKYDKSIPHYEFIFTANGDHTQFASIDFLVSHELTTIFSNWTFTALKPAEHNEMEVRLTENEVNGPIYNTKNLLCRPSQEKYEPMLDLEVFFDLPADADRDKERGLVGAILNLILGERSASMDIRAIKITYTHEMDTQEGCFPMSELPEFVKKWKGRLVN